MAQQNDQKWSKSMSTKEFNSELTHANLLLMIMRTKIVHLEPACNPSQMMMGIVKAVAIELLEPASCDGKPAS
eukprot:scaffold18277_cov94-Skeletonema_dohrnii-CCMP3373.AAC.1